MDVTFSEIERWVNGDDLDDRFDQVMDEEQDIDLLIIAACDDKSLVSFASNRESTKRRFFAFALVDRLVSCLYSPHGLPYPFSRFQGMISLDDYKREEIERIENVYRRCRIVEQMRNSPQEEVKNLGNMILDYRHDQRFPGANTKKLIELLNYQIDSSFRPDTSTYTTRLCQICNDGFKSWVVAGTEPDRERCPFCVLGIEYPQKTGKNAGCQSDAR